MPTCKVKIARLPHAEDLNLLTRGTATAVGFDMVAAIPGNEWIQIHPGQVQMIPAGFKLELEPGWEMQIRTRSGLGSKGILVPNSPATIDPDFRGEVKVLLLNTSEIPFIVKRGHRIAQAVFKQAPEVVFEAVDESELSATERGTGGFGSTGV